MHPISKFLNQLQNPGLRKEPAHARLDHRPLETLRRDGPNVLVFQTRKNEGIRQKFPKVPPFQEALWSVMESGKKSEKMHEN